MFLIFVEETFRLYLLEPPTYGRLQELSNMKFTEIIGDIIEGLYVHKANSCGYQSYQSIQC